MDSVLSTSEAAIRLGISPARVRSMIANGLLKADKVGGRWLIQLSSVEKRQEARRLPGRMFSPGRAWGLLWLASRRHPDWLSPTDISHLRRRLRQASLIDLAPRLQKRAVVHRLRAHPSDLPRIAEELMAQLEIDRQDLVEPAYGDLLEEEKWAAEPPEVHYS